MLLEHDVAGHPRKDFPKLYFKKRSDELKYSILKSCDAKDQDQDPKTSKALKYMIF